MVVLLYTAGEYTKTRVSSKMSFIMWVVHVVMTRANVKSKLNITQIFMQSDPLPLKTPHTQSCPPSKRVGV